MVYAGLAGAGDAVIDGLTEASEIIDLKMEARRFFPSPDAVR